MANWFRRRRPNQQVIRFDGGTVDGPLYQLAYQYMGVPGDYVLQQLGPRLGIPSGASPSTLLLAQHEMVPFVDPAGTLAGLRNWLISGPLKAATLLTGPGGRGKTRRALQLGREAQGAGWTVITAKHFRNGGQIDASGISHFVESKHPPPLLVIVDYAERWPADDLVRLSLDQYLRAPGIDRKLRLLYVARSEWFWTTHGAYLKGQGFETSARAVEAVSHEESGSRRTAMFEAAVRAFSAPRVMNVDAQRVGRPDSLSNEDYGLPLTIQAAALLAVLAEHDGVPAAQVSKDLADPAAVTRLLLEREIRHWTLMNRSDVEHPVRLSPPMMARVAFIATLVGPLPLKSGSDLLRRVDLGLPPLEVLDDHRTCYPPGPAGHYLEPLAPDRLGEDFVATLLIDRQGLRSEGDGAQENTDSLAQLRDEWTGDLARALLGIDGAPSPPEFEQYLPQILTRLVEVALRWRHVATGYVLPALARDPSLAIKGGGTTLARICKLPGIETLIDGISEVVGEAVEPIGDIDLAPGAAEVARVAVRRARGTLDVGNLAFQLRLAAIRIAAVGEHAEALSHIVEAVALLRKLRDASEGRGWTAELMLALGTLSLRLRENGLPVESLRAIEEAGELATSIDSRSRGDQHAGIPQFLVADILDSYGAALSESGRSQDAVEPARAALQIRLAIGAEDQLAHSYHNLAIHLLRIREHEEARDHVTKAIDLRRAGYRNAPRGYVNLLAASLQILGNIESAQGYAVRALTATREAAALFQEACDKVDRLYLPAVASTQSDLGLRLGAVGRWTEALEASKLSVQIYRDAVSAGGSQYRRDLGRALFNLGKLHHDSGSETAAATIRRDAVRISEDLYAEAPGVHGASFARHLVALSESEEALGHRQEAITCAEQVVSLRRKAQLDNRDAVVDLLASLHRLSGLITDDRRNYPAAERVQSEIVEVCLNADEWLTETERNETCARAYDLRALFAGTMTHRLAEAYELAAKAVALRRSLLDQKAGSRVLLASSLKVAGQLSLRCPGALISPGVELLLESFSLQSDLAIADPAYVDAALADAAQLHKTLLELGLPEAAEGVVAMAYLLTNVDRSD